MSVYAIVKKGCRHKCCRMGWKIRLGTRKRKAVLAEGTVDIGWLYDGKEFTP
jgi:hypothetical protein